MPICVKCDRVFPSKRVDARFCSGKCRVAAYRGDPGPPQGAPEGLVTDNRQDDDASPIRDTVAATPERPDDGLRWVDRWGFIHRVPAGNRSQLPSSVGKRREAA
jgi:hypothetical protein